MTSGAIMGAHPAGMGAVPDKPLPTMIFQRQWS